MSRASSDIRHVSISAAQLPTEGWKVWTFIEEWLKYGQEMKDIAVTYALVVAALIIFSLLVLFYLRYRLRQSRIQRYLKEK